MWLLPSRRRPANLARFFAAYRATGGSTPGLILVDTEDYRDNRAAYEAIETPIGWIWGLTAGETQGEKIAERWDEIKHSAWFGLIGDDCVPETPGWDKALVAGLDGANIISCDDGWHAPRRLGNCWVMAGDLVRAVGYIFPPGLHHLFVDDIWEALGREAHCWTVMMAVKVAHRHVLKGEAPADETHRRVYGSDTADANRGMWPTDSAVYEEWQGTDRPRAIAAIQVLRQQIDPAAAARIEARTARLQQRSVLICTPTHGGTAWQYSHSLASTFGMLERRGIRHRAVFVAGSSNLPKARNALCAWFLASEFTDMLFIDADMGWSPNAVLRLLSSAKPIIGAVGRKKIERTEWCLRLLPDSGSDLHFHEGAVEIASIGTGMLRITREALEAIIAERPDLKMDGDPDMPEDVRARSYRFFRFGDADEGEDYTFCALWCSLGGQIWVDPEISLVHVGEREFEGKFGDVLVAVQEAA